MGKAIHYDGQAFDTALQQGGVLVVDFWASWCMPCRMLAPVVEQLAEHFEGRAAVGKVDVDEQPQLAARFGVQSIPTVILFKNGEAVSTLVGVRPFEDLAAAVDRIIGE